MPPKKKLYSDTEGATRSHGHLIEASRRWDLTYKLIVSCNGKKGQMLGGACFVSSR